MVEDRQPFHRWPRKWVREESFWRDVTTRTLAAAIVGILAFVYARFAGYFAGPETSDLVRGAAGIVALLSGVAFVATVVLVVFQRVAVRWLFLSVLLFLVAAGVFVLLVYRT